jgi:hypothetical protein
LAKEILFDPTPSDLTNAMKGSFIDLMNYCFHKRKGSFIDLMNCCFRKRKGSFIDLMNCCFRKRNFARPDKTGPRKFNKNRLHELSEADETRSFGNVLEPR